MAMTMSGGGTSDGPAKDLILLLGEDEAMDYYKRYLAERKKTWDPALVALVEALSKRLSPLEGLGYQYVKVEKKPVSGRVKSFDSLVRSAFRDYAKKQAKESIPGGKFGWESISNLDDVVGVRVVALNLGDIAPAVRQILSDDKLSWDREEIKNFYNKLNMSGYRSWQIKAKFAHGDPPLQVPVEIQVRTRLDDAWAEWDHNLFYKSPPGVSTETWERLKVLHTRESQVISDLLHQANEATDRLRATFEAHARPVPHQISEFLATKRNPGCFGSA